MRLETLKLLEDVRAAGKDIQEFTARRTREDYSADRQLQRAVERSFEIIGEALDRLGRCDRGTLELIPEHRRIIAFRNQLIHGYRVIDPDAVWIAVEQGLPDLLVVVNRLLQHDRCDGFEGPA